jgi:hypothetical protein
MGEDGTLYTGLYNYKPEVKKAGRKTRKSKAGSKKRTRRRRVQKN